MNLRALLWPGVLSTLAGIAVLSGLTWADDIRIVSRETTVPRGATQEFTFAAVPGAASGASTRAALEVVSRMDSPGLGGSMFFLKLKLNGREVQARKTRLAARLANRPLTSPIGPNLTSSWYGNGGWRILYAPDFASAQKLSFYVDNPYRLVLDVTDLVSRTETNHLEITNSAPASLASRLSSPMNLIVAQITLADVPGESRVTEGLPPRPHVINRGEPGAGPAPSQSELLPGGAFALTVEGKRFVFETRISYPKGGFNRLHADAIRGESEQSGWTVQVVRSGDTGEVRVHGPDYSLLRTVRFTSRRIEVADEITNTNPAQDLGLLLQHRTSLASFPSVDVRLAGNNDPAADRYYAPANPTVHLAWEGTALGVVCEDDVFRNQATLFFDAETRSAGVETDKLFIPAGGKAMLRWSVYPLASADYYDFVNLVRQDWGANFTVEGSWCFFGPDQILTMPLADLRARLSRLGVNFACSWGGWVDPKHDRKRIGFGAEVMGAYWSDYRLRLKEAITKLHEARPGIKALVYFDSQRDTHEKAGELFPDSRITGPDGKHGWTDWGGVYSDTWSMFASLDNSFGKAMLETAEAYQNDMGADGLYWDEMENVTFGQPLITYGHTCLLDAATFVPRRQIGLATLLGESHRLQVIDQVRAKSGALMGNGPAHTRRLLQTGVPRMVEIQHNETYAYEGNLGSPLGYQSGRADFAAVTRALSMAMLPVGTRLDYDYDITPHLFPFTPIELHSGYLLGRERIITTHSGNYGWPGEEVPCTLLHFDSRGKLRETIRGTAGPGAARMKVDLQQGEAAVLERTSKTP